MTMLPSNEQQDALYRPPPQLRKRKNQLATGPCSVRWGQHQVPQKELRAGADEHDGIIFPKQRQIFYDTPEKLRGFECDQTKNMSALSSIEKVRLEYSDSGRSTTAASGSGSARRRNSARELTRRRKAVHRRDTRVPHDPNAAYPHNIPAPDQSKQPLFFQSVGPKSFFTTKTKSQHASNPYSYA